jgi:hypothetical protein
VNILNQELTDKLQDFLSQVATLTELSEKRSVDFFPEVKKWLKEVGKVLLQNKEPLGAQMVSYHLYLISVDRDGLLPKGIAFRKPPTKAKAKNGSAVYFVFEAVGLLSSYYYQSSLSGRSSRSS